MNSNNQDSARTLEGVGEIVLRYGLVLVIFWIGCLKFTAYEAQGIQNYASNSPLMSWLYRFLDVRKLFPGIGRSGTRNCRVDRLATVFGESISRRELRGDFDVSDDAELSADHARCLASRLRIPLPFWRSRPISGKGFRSAWNCRLDSRRSVARGIR